MKLNLHHIYSNLIVTPYPWVYEKSPCFFVEVEIGHGEIRLKNNKHTTLRTREINQEDLLDLDKLVETFFQQYRIETGEVYRGPYTKVLDVIVFCNSGRFVKYDISSQFSLGEDEDV